MSKCLFSFVFLSAIIWAIVINYPPSIQQIDLGIKSILGLWALRLLSLFLVTASTYFLSNLLSRRGRIYYWTIIFISPAINVLWLSYPVDCLKIFISSIIIYIVVKKKINLVVSLVALIISLIAINRYYLRQDIALFSRLSTSNSQSEVMSRIAREDTINPHINLPLWFRRIGYNKYYLTIQNTLKEAIKFWDQESIFFQEVHPLDQKSVVIFYWPTIGLLLAISWFYARSIDSKMKRTFLVTMVISWIYFLLSNDALYKQLIMVIFWISLYLTWGTNHMLKNNHTRWLTISLLLTIGYGFITNYVDRVKRPMFWLDNRPIVYQILLTEASKLDYQKYSKIYLTNVIGPADKYCLYYLNNCQQFIFKNFDLNREPLEENSLYLGFIGNYLGLQDDNLFSYNTFNLWSKKNQLNIFNHLFIRDTVAYKYGNDLIIAGKK